MLFEVCDAISNQNYVYVADWSDILSFRQMR